MADFSRAQETTPVNPTDQSPILHFPSKYRDVTIQTGPGNHPDRGESTLNTFNNEPVTPPGTLEVGDRKKVWGPYAGHLFHRIVFEAFRGLNQSAPNTTDVAELIQTIIQKQRYSQLPATEGLSPNQRDQLIYNLRQSHALLAESIIEPLSKNSVVVLSEWKHKPDNRQTKELAAFWSQPDTQDIIAQELGINSTTVPELTYLLIRYGNELSKNPPERPVHESLETFFKEHYIGHEVSHTTEQNDGRKYTYAARQDSPIMRLPTSHLTKQTNNRNWWQEAYLKMNESPTKEEIATLRYLRLCLGAHQEIGQYIGGTYSLHDFTHDPSSGEAYTLAQIANNIKDALMLFSPFESDIDTESAAKEISAMGTHQEARTHLAPPFIIPDLIYVDFGDQPLSTDPQQVITELRTLIKNEEGWNGGDPNFVSHPNFFYNPKILDLLDRAVALGGTIHLEDIKTSLSEPGNPEKYAEKIGFYLATFTQWLIAGRRRQGKDCSLINIATDPIIEHMAVPNIVFAASSLDSNAPWQNPVNPAHIDRKPIWQETWNKLSVLSHQDSDTPPSIKRQLIRELFVPFTLILRKYILRQIVKEVDANSQIDQDKKS